MTWYCDTEYLIDQLKKFIQQQLTKADVCEWNTESKFNQANKQLCYFKPVLTLSNQISAGN